MCFSPLWLSWVSVPFLSAAVGISQENICPCCWWPHNSVIFCPSTVYFSGGGPHLAKHTCTYLAMFTMGPPSWHPVCGLQTAYFILTPRCAFFTFNLYTQEGRERGCNNEASDDPGALHLLYHEEYQVTEGEEGRIFFLLLGMGLPCKALWSDSSEILRSLEKNFFFVDKMKKNRCHFPERGVSWASHIFTPVKDLTEVLRSRPRPKLCWQKTQHIRGV